MSQIFDALHQSATERAENAPREFSAAKELLQVVERKTANSAALPDTPLIPVVREQLRSYTSVTPVLTEESRFVCFKQMEGLAAEKFRFLATRLRHLQQKRSLKRLVITSSVAGEGKSIISANLACALAAAKQQVLLIEGDLRRPVMGEQLGLQDLPGLSQVLTTLGDAQNNIYRVAPSGLHVLLAGGACVNPLEFLDVHKLAGVMDKLASEFDWVIIDSPPVLPLADTSIWMRIADGVLLVTRPGVTGKRQLQRSFEAIEQAKLLGTVLNASTETASNEYYHHYTTNRTVGLQVTKTAAK